MSLDPILSAPVAVQIHVAAALPALLLGPLALARRSRDLLHRLAGAGWVLAMLALAGSSFFIHEARLIGPFSPIHALSVLTLWGLWSGARALQAGDGRAHGRAMRMLYAQALILAGVFTFLPGRRMSLALFPEAPQAGFAVAAVTGLVAAVLVLHGRGRLWARG